MYTYTITDDKIFYKISPDLTGKNKNYTYILEEKSIF